MITRKKCWKKLYDTLGGDKRNTSAATLTRQHYERLLLPFERWSKGLPDTGDVPSPSSPQSNEDQEQVKSPDHINANNSDLNAIEEALDPESPSVELSQDKIDLRTHLTPSTSTSDTLVKDEQLIKSDPDKNVKPLKRTKPSQPHQIDPKVENVPLKKHNKDGVAVPVLNKNHEPKVDWTSVTEKVGLNQVIPKDVESISLKQAVSLSIKPDDRVSANIKAELVDSKAPFSVESNGKHMAPYSGSYGCLPDSAVIKPKAKSIHSIESIIAKPNKMQSSTITSAGTFIPSMQNSQTKFDPFNQSLNQSNISVNFSSPPKIFSPIKPHDYRSNVASQQMYESPDKMLLQLKLKKATDCAEKVPTIPFSSFDCFNKADSNNSMDAFTTKRKAPTMLPPISKQSSGAILDLTVKKQRCETDRVLSESLSRPFIHQNSLPAPFDLSTSSQLVATQELKQHKSVPKLKKPFLDYGSGLQDKNTCKPKVSQKGSEIKKPPKPYQQRCSSSSAQVSDVNIPFNAFPPKSQTRSRVNGVCSPQNITKTNGDFGRKQSSSASPTLVPNSSSRNSYPPFAQNASVPSSAYVQPKQHEPVAKDLMEQAIHHMMQQSQAANMAAYFQMYWASMANQMPVPTASFSQQQSLTQNMPNTTSPSVNSNLNSVIYPANSSFQQNTPNLSYDSRNGSSVSPFLTNQGFFGSVQPPVSNARPQDNGVDFASALQALMQFSNNSSQSPSNKQNHRKNAVLH